MFAMNRAGQEPAEDVVRRIAAALKANGLVIWRRLNFNVLGQYRRFVMVSASPENWPHKLGMLSVEGSVSLNGDLRGLKIFCNASDGDPAMILWDAVGVRGVPVELDQVQSAIHLILQERKVVMKMLAEGRGPPFPELQWKWKVPGQIF